jgi:hypothetical protein
VVAGVHLRVLCVLVVRGWACASRHPAKPRASVVPPPLYSSQMLSGGRDLIAIISGPSPSPDSAEPWPLSRPCARAFSGDQTAHPDFAQPVFDKQAPAPVSAAPGWDLMDEVDLYPSHLTRRGPGPRWAALCLRARQEGYHINVHICTNDIYYTYL